MGTIALDEEVEITEILEKIIDTQEQLQQVIVSVNDSLKVLQKRVIDLDAMALFSEEYRKEVLGRSKIKGV